MLLSVPCLERQEHGDKGTSLARALETPCMSKNVTCSAPVTCPECRSESSMELGTPGESRGWHRTWSKAKFKLSHSPRMRMERWPGHTVLAVAGVGWQDGHAPEPLLWD